MKNKESFIVGLITTKNRESFFDSLNSMISQTLRPDCIIVVSDSDEEYVPREKTATEACGGVFLRERHNHIRNYAGSLNINMGIDCILDTFVINKVLDANQIYIATLDDDDTWQKEYIEECKRALGTNPDFVVSGLIFRNRYTTGQSSIPQQLNIHSFLKGNPGIQGSNTFVKLTTILNAGWFDERMPSCTDRDAFVRIMQLSPCFSIVNKHLVNIDTTGEDRITKNRDRKLEGLRRFYRKYFHLMSEEDRQAFQERNHKYFGIEMKDILDV